MKDKNDLIGKMCINISDKYIKIIKVKKYATNHRWCFVDKIKLRKVDMQIVSTECNLLLMILKIDENYKPLEFDRIVTFFADNINSEPSLSDSAYYLLEQTYNCSIVENEKLKQEIKDKNEQIQSQNDEIKCKNDQITQIKYEFDALKKEYDFSLRKEHAITFLNNVYGYVDTDMVNSKYHPNIEKSSEIEIINKEIELLERKRELLCRN